MGSKELSMQVKQIILRLWGKKSIRDIAETLGVAKSTAWCTLRKKGCTGELGNTKRLRHPWKTTAIDECTILSIVKKCPFTTSSEVRTTLQEVGVSLYKSTMKRRLHKSK